MAGYDFDVAPSFADEDRDLDLVEYLSDVYGKRVRYPAVRLTPAR